MVTIRPRLGDIGARRAPRKLAAAREPGPAYRVRRAGRVTLQHAILWISEDAGPERIPHHQGNVRFSSTGESGRYCAPGPRNRHAWQ